MKKNGRKTRIGRQFCRASEKNSKQLGRTKVKNCIKKNRHVTKTVVLIYLFFVCSEYARMLQIKLFLYVLYRVNFLKLILKQFSSINIRWNYVFLLILPVIQRVKKDLKGQWIASKRRDENSTHRGTEWQRNLNRTKDHGYTSYDLKEQPVFRDKLPP